MECDDVGAGRRSHRVEGGEVDGLHEQWITRSDQKQTLRSIVGDWRRGRWTPAEMKRLRRNVRKYTKKERVRSIKDLVFATEIGQRDGFFKHIARGIKRPLFSVYRKVCREYDLGNYVGHWSPRLVAKLVKYHQRYGNNWAVIGRKIGVSAGAARDKHRGMTCRQRTGAWLPEEVERLVYAVNKIKKLRGLPSTAVDRGTDSAETQSDSAEPESLESESLELESFESESLTEDVATSDGGDLGSTEDSKSSGGALGAWKSVARLVVSRNCMQCRTKWLFHQDWLQRGGKEMWHDEHDLRLLETLLTLAEEGAEDEDAVDWAELAKEWEGARWSGYYLRTKWAAIRRRVPRYSVQSFQDNLSYLEENVLPGLQHSITS